ncbi:integrase [Tritonibacter mobilis]|uniref:integrase n=1 Tax=Tritonibacter mobilis TaxID=379347 RepID=UPI001CD9EBE1|nr:integrase [Tritonibacter mobilis]MCA2007108.1 integrase [Tritonibacter mobilis]
MSEMQTPYTEPDFEYRSAWPVLTHVPLRAGYDRSALSRYDDDNWDLSAAVFRENARRCHCTVRFDALSDPTMAAMMRAYLHARLNIRIPGWAPLLPPASIRQAFNHIRPFLQFIHDEVGSVNLAGVDQALLDRYAKTVMKSKTRQPAANALLLKPIWHLHHYRMHLPDGGLQFEPWPGRSAAFVAGYSSRSQENQTDRIPERILTPLLNWAFKYVQVFATDIFAVRAEVSALEDRAERFALMDRGRSRRDLLALRYARIERWLAARADKGRGVPVWAQPTNGVMRDGVGGTPINWHLLNLVAGVDVQMNPGNHLGLRKSVRQIVERHMAEHGVERGGFDTPVSCDPDTQRPWRSGFDHLALKREERMLQAAGYILCAYLTGMRDCEVQAMRTGCLDITRSEDGLIERYRVRSTAYKWKRAEGSPADWITIKPVAEAISVLERLSKDACVAHGIDTLWPVLGPRAKGKTHLSAEIVRSINAFRDHVNAELARGDGAEPIPTVHNDKVFKITTRQFRRTLAWHIANRPFGTIAGMIQYKHASVAAFEGYAGSSPSGFHRQIEQEHRSGQLEDILEYFDAHRIGDTFGGPAAARLTAAFEETTNDLDALPARIADRGRLRTMLGDLARTFHVGILADCFFDPVSALCLKTATDQSKPLTALCQPTKCPNACIRARHLPAWQRAEADVKAMLKEKRLSATQRSALKAERERIRDVIRKFPEQ